MQGQSRALPCGVNLSGQAWLNHILNATNFIVIFLVKLEGMQESNRNNSNE